MLNHPLLNGIQGGHTRNKECPEESIAFLELFKAISTLNRQPTSTDLSIIDVKVDIEYEGEMAQNEEDKLDINDATEELAKNRSKEKQKRGTNIGNLDQALKRNDYQMVIEIFEEVRSSPNKLLDDTQRTRIFYYLAQINVVKAYDVLKYHAECCKEQGRLVNLHLYLELLHRIRSVEVQHEHRNAKPLSKTDRRIYVSTLQKMVRDITEHIKVEYSEGKKMVYQHLLLPVLVSSLAEHRHPFITQSAKPIMEYILDNQFPQLCPELFEHILESAANSRTGPKFIPYHRVLSWLVSNGMKYKNCGHFICSSILFTH